MERHNFQNGLTEMKTGLQVKYFQYIFNHDIHKER